MKLRKYLAVLLIVSVMLSGCGGSDSGKDKSKDGADTVEQTSSKAQSNENDDKEKSGKSDDEKDDGEKSEKDGSAKDRLNGKFEKDNDSSADSENGKGEVLYREADEKKIETYKKQVRDLVLNDYHYDAEMISSEFYGDFDVVDENDSDQAVVFIGKDEPEMALYLSFSKGKAYVQDIIQFNCPEDEALNGARWYPAVSEATMIDVKENTYDTEKMIYLEIPMGRGKSFRLLDLEGGVLDGRYSFGLSATAMAAIFDKDSDGVYEGFYLDRNDDQTLYYPIYEEFGFAAPSYASTEGWIVLDPMPNDPEELVMEYIKLCSIRDRERDFDYTYIPLSYVDENGQDHILEERLEQMADIPFEEGYVWPWEFVHATAMHMIDGEIGLTSEINGDTAIVRPRILSGIGEGNWDFVEEYYLEKRNGQWVITGQKQLDAGDETNNEQAGLYVPYFLPTDNLSADAVLKLAIQDTVEYNVTVVTEVIDHGEEYILCHVHLAGEPEDLEDDIRINWCVVENAKGELFVTDWNNYIDDSVSVEEYEQSLVYAGGPYDYENLPDGEYGYHERGWYSDGVASWQYYDDSPEEDPMIARTFKWANDKGLLSYRYDERYIDGTEAYMILEITN